MAKKDKKDKKDRKEKKDKKDRSDKKRKRDSSDSDDGRGQKRLQQEACSFISEQFLPQQPSTAKIRIRFSEEAVNTKSSNRECCK